VWDRADNVVNSRSRRNGTAGQEGCSDIDISNKSDQFDSFVNINVHIHADTAVAIRVNLLQRTNNQSPRLTLLEYR
jgi:hypothetical protein